MASLIEGTLEVVSHMTIFTNRKLKSVTYQGHLRRRVDQDFKSNHFPAKLLRGNKKGVKGSHISYSDEALSFTFVCTVP